MMHEFRAVSCGSGGACPELVERVSRNELAVVRAREKAEKRSIASVLLLGPVLIYCELMRLRLVVEHDSETKRWAAFFPELPGCTSAGDTEDEAIQNAKEALELWFAL